MSESISIPVNDSLSLAGVLHQPSVKTQSGVVICHGMLSYKDSPKHVGLARGLCERGHAVLRFDFQGRGDSPGDLLGLTFSRQVQECLAAVSTLKDRCSLERVGLAGSSMGAAVSILAARAARASGLATLAGVARTDLLPERLVTSKALEFWQRKGSLRLLEERIGWSLVEDGRKVDVPGAAAAVSCPWLIVHGTQDEVVPQSDAQCLHDASDKRAQLELVPGADHRFSQAEHLRLVTDLVVNFLDSALADQ